MAEAVCNDAADQLYGAVLELQRGKVMLLGPVFFLVISRESLTRS